ncbi:MAG: hypothetical protein WC966_07435 [Bradymonadales bacterium]|jgi:hypothetical protein
MRLDLRNRTQACVSAAQIVVGIVECGNPAQSVGLTRRGKLPPQKKQPEYRVNQSILAENCEKNARRDGETRLEN